MIDGRPLTGQEMCARAHDVLLFAVLLITFEQRAAIAGQPLARSLARGDYAAESGAERSGVADEQEETEKKAGKTRDDPDCVLPAFFFFFILFFRKIRLGVRLLVAPELLPSPIKSLDAHLVKHRRI